MMRSEVFASEPIYPWLFDEQRPPLLTAIVGESYGGSSFMAAMSDITVMLLGSVMALTSPRVITMATGATPTPDELGGANVLAARTDLVDVVVHDYAELDRVLRHCLSFFTDPCTTPGTPGTADIRDLVPADESQVYDIRAVIAGIADEGSFQELGAERGRSLVTGLGRVDGRVVGFVASQPLHEAGALPPVGCAKAERLTRLCSRFDFPVVALVDTPGFQIGLEVEHSGMLRRAMDLIKTNTAAPCSVVTLILRKAFGLAFFAMFSPDHGGDVVLAWPDAHVGFMAPATAANVLYGDEYAHLAPDVRRRQLSERAESLGASSKVQDVAAAMGIDEIVDPASTVSTIRRYLNLLSPRNETSRATGRKIDL
jgi:acetyl-CoA carboxylase carboxyltransferase component